MVPATVAGGRINNRPDQPPLLVSMGRVRSPAIGRRRVRVGLRISCILSPVPCPISHPTTSRVSIAGASSGFLSPDESEDAWERASLARARVPPRPPGRTYARTFLRTEDLTAMDGGRGIWISTVGKGGEFDICVRCEAYQTINQ